ncbi:MAG: hypothetical protein ACYCPQ_03905 [Elusimicrobiota bacterium]
MANHSAKHRKLSFVIFMAAYCLGAGRVQALSPITVATPPGWQKVSPSTSAVVVALRGPAQSSFILALNPAALDMADEPGLNAFLADVLDAFNQRALTNFSASGDVKEKTFSNGITAHYIKATSPGKPPIILAAMQVGNQNFIGTLISNIPDLMLPAILGSLNIPGERNANSMPISASTEQSSADGQLSFAPKNDWRAVLALQGGQDESAPVFEAKGMGSRLRVTKVANAEIIPIADEPAVVLSMARAFPGVDPGSISQAKFLRTPAGPTLIYAAAHRNNGDELFAGYLPWSYGGYSVLAEGPNASRLALDIFSGLTLGAAAIPSLVAATPGIPRWNISQGAILSALLAPALMLALYLAMRRRKNPKAPPHEPAADA